jgi:hypothetical protein
VHNRKVDYSNLIGNKIHRLTILETISKPDKTSSRKRKYFICVCECGNTAIIEKNSVLSGNTESCGCLRRNLMKEKATKHGFANKEKFTEGYRSWYAMRQRCNNPKHPRYSVWGGRGISICKRWNSFSNFIYDMGPRPTKSHSIDRIDNDGNYEPSNCRWATKSEQSSNQRPRKKGYKQNRRCPALYHDTVIGR